MFLHDPELHGKKPFEHTQYDIEGSKQQLQHHSLIGGATAGTYNRQTYEQQPPLSYSEQDYPPGKN